MGQLPFFPVAASTVAGQTDLLLTLLIGLSSFFSGIVLILIFYFGIKYRRGRDVDRSNPPVGNTRMELAWMGGLLVLGLGTFTWATFQYYNITRIPKDAMEMYVVGQQWMWKFQHTEGQQEINDLHVPLGRPVRLIMTSEDVIHSFYVPAFRLKYDVIPGRYTNLWFQATRAGQYHIFCAEFCGTNHSRMIGTIIVMEPREYAAWLSGGGQSQGSVPVAQAGQQLFQQLGCSSCHVQGAGATAPTLEGLFGQTVPLEGGGTAIADESYIRESILFPERQIVAGYQPIMPTYEGRISEEQLLQIVAYIKSLSNPSAPAGQPAGGAGSPGQGTPGP